MWRGGGWLLSQLNFHDTFTWICLATMLGKNYNNQPFLLVVCCWMNPLAQSVKKSPSQGHPDPWNVPIFRTQKHLDCEIQVTFHPSIGGHPASWFYGLNMWIKSKFSSPRTKTKTEKVVVEPTHLKQQAACQNGNLPPIFRVKHLKKNEISPPGISPNPRKMFHRFLTWNLPSAWNFQA